VISPIINLLFLIFCFTINFLLAHAGKKVLLYLNLSGKEKYHIEIIVFTLLIMNLESYTFIKRPESHYYEFYSNGPNGSIKKVVEYYNFPELEAEVFNLAFGDWDEDNHRINDLVISNNADRDKVLATIAATVIEFMKEHPHAILVATGSTLSRARLYQIGIARLWYEINQSFEIYGYVNESWQPFERGVNYTAFLLRNR
jgi:hypothetical protein